MAKDRPERTEEPQENHFAIRIDDDLLADALAAAEARFGGEDPAVGGGDGGGDDVLLEGPDEPADGATSEDGQAPGDGEIEVDLDDLGEPPLEPPAAGDADEIRRLESQLARLRTRGEILEEDLNHQVAAATSAAAARDAAREELERTRDERDEARARANDSLRKAAMMVKKARRKDDLNDRLRLEVDDARGTMQQWEQILREQRRQLARGETEREMQRSRHQRELEEKQRFGQERLLKTLLPVLDHFDLAILHADTDPERLREGVEMIFNQLMSVLNRAGLERVTLEEGDLFDPERHEAIEQVEREDLPDNTVVKLHQHGYALNSRLLRAARVSVTVQPAEEPSAPEAAGDEAGEDGPGDDGAPEDGPAEAGAPGDGAPRPASEAALAPDAPPPVEEVIGAPGDADSPEPTTETTPGLSEASTGAGEAAGASAAGDPPPVVETT